jgi:hypothetical protein
MSACCHILASVLLTSISRNRVCAMIFASLTQWGRNFSAYWTTEMYLPVPVSKRQHPAHKHSVQLIKNAKSTKFVYMAIVMCATDVKSQPKKLLMLTPAEHCLDYTHKWRVGEVAAWGRRYSVSGCLSNGETNGSLVTRSRANRVNVGT